MSEPTGAVETTAAPTAPEAPAGASLEAKTDVPSIAPDHEAPQPDPPKVQAPVEASAIGAQVEPPKIEAVKPDAAAPEADSKVEPKFEPKPGKLIVMTASDPGWDHEQWDHEARDRESFAPHVKADAKEHGSKRRFAAVAAIVVLAAAVGAISGALATAGVMHLAVNQPASDNSALEASIARIDADVVALKANLEHTSRTGLSQFNKTNDRLDKLEKAQAEPMAKLAKLSESVDKLRTAQAAAPAQANAAKDITGSIAPAQVASAAPNAPSQAAPAQAAVPLPMPKPEIGRLPTVDGWRLRDVANGGALIEGRSGLYEVYAGDPVPGLGRIDAIRRQDGRWVVVTSRGLIVAR
jgi:hypothetical protein